MARLKRVDQLTAKTAVFDSFEAGRILREELHSAAQTFGEPSRNAAWALIAERTELSKSTLGKIANGETRFPRWSTSVLLLDYFGWEVAVVRKTNNVVQIKRKAVA
jgi:hypothetical protein